MSGLRHPPTAWETETYGLLAQIQRDKETVAGRLAALTTSAAALTEALRIYKGGDQS